MPVRCWRSRQKGKNHKIPTPGLKDCRVGVLTHELLPALYGGAAGSRLVTFPVLDKLLIREAEGAILLTASTRSCLYRPGLNA
jgi:hypothetical protein